MNRLLCLVCLLLLLGIRSTHAQNNVLANPGFEGAAGAPAGWGAFWSRTPGAGAATLDMQTTHGGQRALKVVHPGANDWSVEQTARIPVAPGDVFRLGGWVKCEAAQSIQLSVVTRRANGDTLEWIFGAVETSGTHDWQALERRFVVPPDCATIQFRLTGDGKATAWFDDLTLAKTGNVQALGAKWKGRMLRARTRFLDVALTPQTGQLTVTDRRDKRAWRQLPLGAGLIVEDARRATPMQIMLGLWDVANDLHLKASVTLAADAPEIAVTLGGAGLLTEPVAFPAPFATQAGDRLVVPLNEGILYPADDTTIGPMSLVTYSGHGLCMPWFGVADAGGAGVMAILQTPDDAHMTMDRALGGTLHEGAVWEASRGQVGYARKLTYVFFTQGGYVAQAKRYRQYAHTTGLFKTLVQKRRAKPTIDKLIGAVNVWNWDMDKVALCREMKALGMERVLWSSGGSPTELAAINTLGYLTSRYDIYQDVYPPDAPEGLRKDGWPEDLVWLPNGDWMKGWADIRQHPDGTQTVYQGGVICSSRGLARAKIDIPADLKTHPYQCRFLDTTTASPWRECYNPAHPLTRSQDRAYKMALLKFCAQDMNLVVGTETGIDPSVPYADYYEGMMSLGPYRLPDAGRDMLAYKPPTPDFLKFQVGHQYRIPLWELVYHDCTVAQWYWGDYNNKAPEVWDRRDLFNILYGTPPMFMFDKPAWAKDKTRFVQSEHDICPLVRRLGYDEMLSHDFLTADHALQRTRWRSGTEIVANFGATPQRLADGRTVRPLGWIVSGPVSISAHTAHRAGRPAQRLSSAKPATRSRTTRRASSRACSGQRGCRRGPC